MKKNISTRDQRTHIKRDGGLMCGKDKGSLSWFYKTVRFYKFSNVHKMRNPSTLINCKDCLRRYYDVLAKMPNLVIDGKEQTV